jgi:hypothetical protein
MIAPALVSGGASHLSRSALLGIESPDFDGLMDPSCSGKCCRAPENDGAELEN